MTDANGCTNVAETTLVVNPTPIVSIDPVDAVCIGAEITLTTNGPVGTYEWTGDGLNATTGQTVTASTAGFNAGTYTYTVTLTDTNGCTNTASVDVQVDTNPDVVIDPVAPVCQGTAFDLSASNIPGATYDWSGIGISGTGQTVTVSAGLAAGTYDYNVTVTDANGCSGTAATTVVVNPEPVVSIDPTDDICEYETATLVANGPAGTYEWTGDGLDNTTGSTVTVSDLTAGDYDYTVTMTDANGCSATASTTLTVNPTPTVSIEPLGSVCETTEVTLTATGSAGVSEWSGEGLTSTSGQSVTATNLSVGTYVYTVTITDANGCTNTDEATLEVDGTPVVSIDPVAPICEDATVTLAANGSGTFEWSGAGLDATTGPTVTASGLTAGTYDYTVTITDASGCTNTATTTVAVNETPIIGIAPVAEICEGDDLILEGTDSGTFDWEWSSEAGLNSSSENPLIIVNIAAGTYNFTVTLTDVSGCTNTATTVIEINGGPDVVITPVPETCEGEDVVLVATGSAGTYTWSGDGLTSTNGESVTATGLTDGTYTYTVNLIDENGCEGSDEITVTITETPFIAITPVAPVCIDESFELVANGGAGTYEWSGDNLSAVTGSTVNVTGLSASGIYTYTVTLTSASGCTNTASVEVEVGANPVVVINDVGPVCEGEDIILTTTGATGTCIWTGEGLSLIHI